VTHEYSNLTTTQALVVFAPWVGLLLWLLAGRAVSAYGVWRWKRRILAALRAAGGGPLLRRELTGPGMIHRDAYVALCELEEAGRIVSLRSPDRGTHLGYRLSGRGGA
jgi:hypothetical protein